MRIRMLEDRLGSPNGYKVYLYRGGEEYSGEGVAPVSAELAKSFVDGGFAVELDDAGNPKAPPAAKRSTKTATKATQGLRVDEDDEG